MSNDISATKLLVIVIRYYSEKKAVCGYLVFVGLYERSALAILKDCLKDDLVNTSQGINHFTMKISITISLCTSVTIIHFF